MSPDVIFGAIVLVPVVLLMVLRVNAALVFLSLCLGSVLVQFVANDVNSFVALFSAQAPDAEIPDNSTVSLALLLLPAILTTIFMIKTVSGKLKLALNLLPAAGVGLMGALLVVPLLSPDLSDRILESKLWTQAENAQELIIGSSAVMCLLALWAQRPKTGFGKHDKKHH